MKTLQESILGSQEDIVKGISDVIELEQVFNLLLVERDPKKFDFDVARDRFLALFRREGLLQEFDRCPTPSKFPEESGFWIVTKEDSMSITTSQNKNLTIYYSTGQTMEFSNPVSIHYELETNQDKPNGRWLVDGGSQLTQKVISRTTKNNPYKCFKTTGIYFIPCAVTSDIYNTYRKCYKKMKLGNF